jgi:hypothetical protein
MSIKKRVVLSVAGLLAVSVQAEKPVKVFLCSGQSNMAGAGNMNRLSAEDKALFPDKTVRYWCLKTDAADRTCKWNPLGTLSGSFGPEQTFALEMKKLYPDRQIAVVKVAKGATPINFWLPAEAGSDPLGCKTLLEAIAQTTIALNGEKAAGAIPDWSWGGFVWMQGEGDANGTMEPAGTYLTKLKRLAAIVREKTGTPQLPVVIGRISWQLAPSVVRESGMLRVSQAKSPDGKGGIDNRADYLDDGKKRGPIWFEQKLVQVRNDQEAFCAQDGHAAWADIDDLAVKDNWHYNADGYAEIGRRFARACQTLSAP